MIVAYKAKGRAIFLFGFPKNELENIDQDELLSFRVMAEELLTADAARIREEVAAGRLQEIEYEEEKD